MKLRASVRWLILCLVLGSLPLVAAQSQPVQRQPPLVFLGDSDYPPLSYLDGGVPKGIDVDIAMALGREIGREIRVELMDWDVAQERVLRGEADGLLSMSVSPERADAYDFTDATGSHDFGVFVRSGDLSIRGTADLAGKRVAVTPGGLPRRVLPATGAELALVRNYPEGLDRLANGTIDALAADIWVASHTVERQKVQNIVAAGPPFATLPAGIAVKKGNASLLVEINQAVQALSSSGMLEQIQSRWRSQEMIFVSRGRLREMVLLASVAFFALIATAGLLLRQQRRTQAERRAAEAKAHLTEDAAARSLRASEERYREVVESANDIIFTVDPGGYCLSMNRAGREITGYVADNARGINLTALVVPEQADFAAAQLRRVIEGALVPRFELDILSKSGTRLTLELDVRPVLAGDVIIGVQGIARDVTARKALEAQLGQLQKVEEVGRLAGGVAHDFNNILTVIIGFAQLAAEQLETSSPVRRDIEEIRRAAYSAASLTRQLLIFSRKNIAHPRVFAIDKLVDRLEKMLRRLLGEHIEFIVRQACPVCHIRADAGQLEQVVLNLVVNASDAMPSGGTLTIETHVVQVDDGFVRLHAGSSAGEYVRLTVTDTGHGMSAEVQKQIFLPFFTTKGPGAGTGLGLATAHRIVQQAGGFITVDSSPGHGASFGVYLPIVSAPVDPDIEAAERQPPARVLGTILFAEDDEGIRALGARALSGRGYLVLPARDAAEARRLAASHVGRIDLLFTDVVMPGLNGHELAEELRRTRPGMKVLYTSGYAEDPKTLQELEREDVAFIQKPYAPLALTQKVRELLET